MDKINTDFKLSEHQITSLFQFVQKKFVHWYDLQIEIVDHLASSIEAEMQATSITFELALEKVYSRFGIFGFAKIVQEKQVQLQKTAKKMWWNELLDIFKWPGILQLLLFISIVSTILLTVSSYVLNAVFLFTYITISILFFIYVIRDLRIQRRLLLMQSGAGYFSAPFTFEFIFLFNFSEFNSLFFSVLLSIGILLKLTSFKLYRKIRKEAAVLYPTVFEIAKK